MEKIQIESSGFDFDKIFKESFVDVSKDIIQPPIAVSIGTHEYKGNTYPNPFATYGNFSALIGQSKARKSFLKSLLNASYIGGNATNYGEDMKTHRKDDKMLLDFDTEQSEYHSQRVFKRTCEIVGKNWDNYKPFSLRRYTHKERLQFIEWCLYDKYKGNVGFVSIDGIADLVADVNDLKECNNVIQKLLEWTDVTQCHILAILHANHGSEKATGHLGSAVTKKAETVCLLEYGKESTRVKFQYTRGFPIDDFEFTINGDGLPITRPIDISSY